MRLIDNMTTSELDTLQLKGMLKSARASQLAAFADKAWIDRVVDAIHRDSEPVHVPGELDHLDEPQDRDGGPDTWTDAERNR